MPNFRFNDWYPRQYDRPDIGTVEPGDVKELDEAPDDGHWSPAVDLVEVVSENPDNESDPQDVRKSGQTANDDGAAHDALTNEGAPPVGAEKDDEVTQ